MKLAEFFHENNKVAIAFSGGVDSSYLLYIAQSNGCIVNAYYVKTIFQPEFELIDAKRLAQNLNIPLKILHLDISSINTVMVNTSLRCYHCKKAIMEKVIEEATKDGFTIILDGTNASDDTDDRPGMKATKELNIRSPLRECDITKDEIRKLSKQAGLNVWNKPAYACLATRIPTNIPIDKETLYRIEQAEEYLKTLGFFDFRIRVIGDIAKIQVRQEQLDLVMSMRTRILENLSKFFSDVLLDLKER